MNWRDRSSGGLVVLRVGVVVHNTFHLVEFGVAAVVSEVSIDS